MKCIIDNNTAKLPIATVRHYWKYSYEAWAQPIATSNSTQIDGGVMITSASSNNDGSTQIYGALDGVKSGSNTINTWVPTTPTTGWWQVKFPYKIKITGLVHYNSIGAYGIGHSVQGRYYTSSNMGTPIGDSISTPATNWAATTITGIQQNGVLTDTIYFNKTDGAYAGIGELQITAQKQTVVEGTEQDYDFYTDDNTYFGINQ